MNLHLENLNVYDALALAIDGKYFVSSGNMDWIPHLPLRETMLQLRTDGHWGPLDPFVSPQEFCMHSHWNICIPTRPDSSDIVLHALYMTVCPLDFILVPTVHKGMS